MTRASSMGVVVRGGALARRSRTLCSGREQGLSITAGANVCPCSIQRAKRLKPSMTSKEPSCRGATRMGSSAVDSIGRSAAAWLRNASRLVRRSVMGICDTTGEASSGGGRTEGGACISGSEKAAALLMAMACNRGRAGGAHPRKLHDRCESRGESPPDRRAGSGRPFGDEVHRRGRVRANAGG